jgi:hypothetical protein
MNGEPRNGDGSWCDGPAESTPYGAGQTLPPTVPVSPTAGRVVIVDVGTSTSDPTASALTLSYVHAYQPGRVRSDGRLT